MRVFSCSLNRGKLHIALFLINKPFSSFFFFQLSEVKIIKIITTGGGGGGMFILFCLSKYIIIKHSLINADGSPT